MCGLRWLITATILVFPGAYATAATVTLYDASAGGGTETPADQGFSYFAINASNPFDPVDATMAAAGGWTDLDTTGDRAEYAGFFTHNPFNGAAYHPDAPTLDRLAGFTLSFDLSVLAEGHNTRDDNGDGKDDRAGFSVIAISSDLLGLELAFFHDGTGQNEIWVYEDDTPEVDLTPGASDLFTQAESVLWSDTVTDYDLTFSGNQYELFAGGTSILSGSLRDYTPFVGPTVPLAGQLDPYQRPNLIFFGDDTGSADSHVQLGDISVTLVPEPSTVSLLLLGATGLLFWRRKRSHRNGR